MRVRRVARILLALVNVAIVLSAHLLHAQEEDAEEYEKLNTNIGVSWSVPLDPTSKFVNFGWGIVSVGAGYNFNHRHSFIGEFMWNSLYPTNAAVAPLRIAAHSRNINAHDDLFALTMNYRYELRGKTVGGYFIGGGGLYYRTAHVTREIVTGRSIACTPEWLFWGFTCESGTVSTDQTLASFSSGVLGGNAGIGVTFKVGEPRYRMYIEARYHRAPNKGVGTKLIPITVGIRF